MTEYDNLERHDGTGKHGKKIPQSEKGPDKPVRGRRKIIGAVIEDHTFLIFQVALARRRIQDILEAEDLATALWFRELTFAHIVLSDVHSLLRRHKSWLVAFHEELREIEARDES